MIPGLGVHLSQTLWVTFGNFPGFGATLAYLPTKGITAVVLANRDDTTPITGQTADLLLEAAAEADRRR